MSDTVFFRLLEAEDKTARLQAALASLRNGEAGNGVYLVRPNEFSRVPSSPFAYWISASARTLFGTLSPFASDGRETRNGIGTTDDFRFIRVWWEVKQGQLLNPPLVPIGSSSETPQSFRLSSTRGQRWATLATGGSASAYYRDPSAVMDWAMDGAVLKQYVAEKMGSASRNVRGQSAYFRPGLTWPLRGIRLTTQALPTGALFTVAGKFGTSAHPEELPSLLGLLNAQAFDYLVGLFAGKVGGVQYQSGLIASVPIPKAQDLKATRIGDLALTCLELKRDLDRTTETSHVFSVPAALRGGPVPLVQALAAWERDLAEVHSSAKQLQAEIDAIALGLYGITEEDISVAPAAPTTGDGQAGADDEDSDQAWLRDRRSFAAAVPSWAVGCTFGRFDVRVGLDTSLAPTLQGPFDPLPVCSPGMLVGPDGLPAQPGTIVNEDWSRARPNAITLPPESSVSRPIIPDSEYPLQVDWDGILVDDPENEDDIVRRVREVLEQVWKEGAVASEEKACEILSAKGLREYFRNPKHFWDDHIKRYSRSRRKAPIYWLLQSPKRSYALWIYYHRLDKDIFFKALRNYVDPKLNREQNRLRELRDRLAGAAAGREQKTLEKQIDDQEEVVNDVMDFKERLEKVAALGLDPDLNDGVILNIAPLHELVPWKEPKAYWEELLAGKYDWSTIGEQLRNKGLVRG